MEKEKIRLKKCVEISYVDWSGCFHLKCYHHHVRSDGPKAKIYAYYCWIVVSFLFFSFLPFLFVSLKKKKRNGRVAPLRIEKQFDSGRADWFVSLPLSCVFCMLLLPSLFIYIFSLLYYITNTTTKNMLRERLFLSDTHPSTAGWLFHLAVLAAAVYWETPLQKKKYICTYIEENIFM